MNRFFVATILFLLCLSVVAQDAITLKFTGRNQNEGWIPLSRVFVQDIDQNWQEILYYPDTILTLGNVGIEDSYSEETVRLFQNVPNPFAGVTFFSIQLNDAQKVKLEIFDVNGKSMTQYNNSLPRGVHLFQAKLTTPQTYLLSAKTKDGTMHIKMVNAGSAGENGIEYLGSDSFESVGKERTCKGESSNPFQANDMMVYTGYANLDNVVYVSNDVVSYLFGSDSIIFSFMLPLPEVTTGFVGLLGTETAEVNGGVNANGHTVTEKAFYYGLNPEDLDVKVNAEDVEEGSFKSVLTGLQPGTTYFYKASASTVMGSGEGSVMNFRTNNAAPTVTTQEVTNINSISAIGHGNVVSNNGVAVSERGVCWSSTAQMPSLGNSQYAACSTSGNGAYTVAMNGLSANTTYFVRAYATNVEGTSYGEMVSFSTLEPSVPTVTTASISSITDSSAVSGGDVVLDGGADVIARGICWSLNPNPTLADNYTVDGVGLGSYISQISDLTYGTTYYVRAYATNSVGTAYGEQMCFVAAFVPTLTTGAISAITDSSAVSGGIVILDGGAEVTARGVCWSMNPNPTLSDNHTVDSMGVGGFISHIVGLQEGVTYYVRAYATNGAGTAYGNQLFFTTTTSFLCGTSTVTDYDGNVYNTVRIGSQCWMKQNLKTTHYSDGALITVCESVACVSETTAYRFYPNNVSGNVNMYGYLYNWKAVMRNADASDVNPSGVQGICPTGWHVPSDAEWTQLTTYVSSQSAYQCGGDSENIAKALASTTGWDNHTSLSCAIGSTSYNNNATGFSVVPASYFSSGFNPLGEYARFWSSTLANNGHNVKTVNLNYYSEKVGGGSSLKSNGNSVRCIKDENHTCFGVSEITDYDGNTYHTVQIGNQCWMRENLRSTHFANGDEIPLVGLLSSESPGRYYPFGDSSNVAPFGYVYNWMAVMNGGVSSMANPSGVQGVCPTGWHVPSDAEWTQFTTYVSSQSAYQCGGDSENIAKALASTTGWEMDSTTCVVGNMLAGNNATGFSAFPAGMYSVESSNIPGFNAAFWSATQAFGNSAYCRRLFYNLAAIYNLDYIAKHYGCSVRCLRD